MYLGEIECTLSEIIGSRGSLLTKPLEFKDKPTRKNGFISVRADEIRDDNHDITVQFSCKNLDKKDFFGKSDRKKIYFLKFKFKISFFKKHI